MIQAVIFDLDGTLIDSEQVWNRANRSFLEKYGIHAEPEDLYPTIGGSMDVTYRVLYSFFEEGTMTMSRMRHEYDAEMEGMTIRFAELLDPDAKEVLEYLKEAGVRTAVASASSLPYVESVLKECGIRDLFDEVISGELFDRNKPSPDVYLVAAEKLGIPASACAAAEDSLIGIKAAKEAGMIAAGVKEYGNQDLSGADVRLKRLSEMMEWIEYERRKDSLIRLYTADKELVLIPTAHVSKNSALFAKGALKYEKPDSICIELDEDRYQSLTQKKKWEDTDIRSIVKDKKVGYFMVNLLLASYQKRIAKNLGSNSGQEMAEGIKAAKERNIPLVLADRSIQTTFTRIWRGMRGKDKFKLLSSFVSSVFEEEDISEEDIAKLSERGELEAALGQIQKEFPGISKVLVTERDQYLAYKVKTAPGKKVAAVLGAAHTVGMQEWINRDYDIAELDTVPPKRHTGKIILWTLIALLAGLVIYTCIKNPEMGKAEIINWILWHGILSAAGCALCMAHPLTILTGFLAAPLSSLSPMLAAGWFAGMTEATLRKPTVKDFESLPEDVNSLRGFFRNKVTKIMMIVILSNIGSSAATLFMGIDIVKTFLDLFR
ncbi:MAG: TraB family protein [Erysipelotrichales bacterium]|nr:TraB family protein [Erysipelotrichales bacterium]